MEFLKQSTAKTVRIGPFLDKSDGVTPETGLGGNGGGIETNVRLSKDGAAYGTRNSTTDPAHDIAGWYSLHLDATDTNTLGSLKVEVNDEATHLPVWLNFMVMPANVWDSLFGSDNLQVDSVEISSNQTVADKLETYWDRFVLVNHDGNAVTSGAALKAALDAAVAGDWIIADGGTFNFEDTNVTVPAGVRLSGLGRETTFLQATDNGDPQAQCVILNSNTHIHDFTATSTNPAGVGVYFGNGTTDILIERVNGIGKDDGMVGISNVRVTIRGPGRAFSNYDGIVITTSSNITIEDYFCHSDCTRVNTEMRGIYLPGGVNNVVRRCVARMDETAANTGGLVGIHIGTGGLIEDCIAELSLSHASSTGPTTCFQCEGDSNIVNSTAKRTNAGSGANRDLRASAGTLTEYNCRYSTTDGTVVKGSQTGDNYARLGAPVGASISADIAAKATQASVDAVDDFLDTEVAAIKAKTDNLPASPAAVGSAMTLADDAITAGKFDESTAFPLKQADTGSSAVLRTGADADTGETLSDQIDGVEGGTPAQVHNREPVKAFTSKLGTRADQVIKAFPTQRIAPGEITQLWVDCSAQLSNNIENVTNGASDDLEILLDEVGMFGKMVSFIVDATAADDGDAATLSCDVQPFGGQLIKVLLDVVCDAD